MRAQVILALALAAACASPSEEGGDEAERECSADRDCPSSKPDCRQGRCRTRSSTSADAGPTQDGRPASDGGGVGCTPRTCEELAVECGAVADGCLGFRYCGDCEAPETCGGGGTANFCGCLPDCTALECGDDGCGGSCGDCDGATPCVDGACCVDTTYGECDPLAATPCCPGLTCTFYGGSYGYLCFPG
jgi:hypothetical protein